jgi:hypothetical protein
MNPYSESIITSNRDLIEREREREREIKREEVGTSKEQRGSKSRSLGNQPAC